MKFPVCRRIFDIYSQELLTHRSQVPGQRSQVRGHKQREILFLRNKKKIVIAFAHTVDELDLKRFNVTVYSCIVDGQQSTSVKYLAKASFTLSTSPQVSLPSTQRYLHQQPFSTHEEILVQGLPQRLISGHCTLYCPFSPSK